MQYHGFVIEQSRKAKACRVLYDYLRQKVSPHAWSPEISWEGVQGVDGIPVPSQDKSKVMNLRLHDEQYSPYFKTDMNLFHMLMMDYTVEATVYRADRGWLFVLEGIPEGPLPFGQNGFDTR